MQLQLPCLRKRLPSPLFFPLPKVVLASVLVVFCSVLLSSCSIPFLAQPQAQRATMIDGWGTSLTCNGKQVTNCHGTITNEPRSHHSLQWQLVGSSPAGATFSPASGTLAVGQSQDVLVTFARAAACPVRFDLELAPVDVGTASAHTALQSQPGALWWDCNP
jgi:hypothetical protein